MINTTPKIAKLSNTMLLLALLELGPTTNKKLSEYLQWKTTQTSRVVRELEQSGLVKTNKGNWDERTINIKLTKKGKIQAYLGEASMKVVSSESELDNLLLSFFEGVYKKVKKR